MHDTLISIQTTVSSLREPLQQCKCPAKHHHDDVYVYALYCYCTVRVWPRCQLARLQNYCMLAKLGHLPRMPSLGWYGNGLPGSNQHSNHHPIVHQDQRKRTASK